MFYVAVFYRFQPEPGLESRPDRILVSSPAMAVGAELIGNNSEFRYKYFYHIVWSRFENVLRASHDAAAGTVGSSCIHDCGPHASCRCGVCVAGGNANACLTPKCGECTTSGYYAFLLFVAGMAFIVGQLIYAILCVLLVMNDSRRRQESTSEAPATICIRMSDQCCLCEPELYRSVSDRMKRGGRRCWPCHRACPFSRLPPMFLVVATLLLLTAFIGFAIVVFEAAIFDVFAIIPEELYPSDHLMLTVTIRFD